MMVPTGTLMYRLTAIRAVTEGALACHTQISKQGQQEGQPTTSSTDTQLSGASLMWTKVRSRWGTSGRSPPACLMLSLDTTCTTCCGQSQYTRQTQYSGET